MQNIEEIKKIHLQAFGEEEGELIANLAGTFLPLKDTISITATRDNKIVGNVLFTPFYFDDFKDKKCYLLAPLGVLPEYNRQGVGKELVQKGIEKLKSMGVDAVFVLGVPSYYPQHGFKNTDKQTPYPELLATPEGWFMLELNKGSMDNVRGKTKAIPEFMDKIFWDTSQYGEKK